MSKVSRKNIIKQPPVPVSFVVRKTGASQYCSIPRPSCVGCKWEKFCVGIVNMIAVYLKDKEVSGE